MAGGTPDTCCFMSLIDEMTRLATAARAASRSLARLTAGERDDALRAMADGLERGAGELLERNRLDLETGRSLGLTAAMLDRLRLDDSRIHGMAQGLREVADLPSPLGRVLVDRTRPNGLRLRKVTTPIGVIVVIYESRPNVTADAAGLCFKTGNATILRGGKEAWHSNGFIADQMNRAAGACLGKAFPGAAIQVVPTTDREAIPALLSLTGLVDLCMPRGGEGLIRAVTACSKVPVIKHFKGVCHIFVDAAADPAMAVSILLNAKTQRPSACNAAETLLVHEAIAPEFLPAAAAQLDARQVELRVDSKARNILEGQSAGTRVRPLRDATDADYDTEYNDLVLNVRVVSGLDDAIAHIGRHGSAHSDAIVTADAAVARRFLDEVDSAAVYWNASTRFTDGGEFGMGAEIGISTDKIGARGPMGLDELCSYKWIGTGTGQVRT